MPTTKLLFKDTTATAGGDPSDWALSVTTVHHEVTIDVEPRTSVILTTGIVRWRSLAAGGHSYDMRSATITRVESASVHEGKNIRRAIEIHDNAFKAAREAGPKAEGLKKGSDE